MKPNTPMKSLKHYIDLISSALGKDYLLSRLDMQGEKQDSEYSFGTKGIQADHVIFWTERCDSLGEREVRRLNKTKHIMANPSIGFSFQYLGLKSPLVIFSFVAPHKEKNVEYSLPFTVEETRTLLKSIMKQEFETPDHLMMTLRKCFLDLQIEDQCVLGAVSNRADVIKNEKEFFGGIIAEKINPAMELMEAFPAAKKEMNLGLARLRDKLKETPEHKAVIEAQEALRIAEEKLAEKRSELFNEDSELMDASEIVNSASNRPCLGDVLAEKLSKLIGLAITDDDIRTKVRIGLINKAHKTLICKFNPLIMLGEVGDEYRLNSVINDFRQKLQQQRKQ